MVSNCMSQLKNNDFIDAITNYYNSATTLFTNQRTTVKDWIIFCKSYEIFVLSWVLFNKTDAGEILPAFHL